MATDTIKRISREFYEAYDRSDWSGLEAIMAPQFIQRLGTEGRLDRGSFIGVCKMFAAAFSDSQTVFEDQLVDAEKVVTRWVWSMRHTGDFQGIPATGRTVAVAGVTINRFDGEQIVEQWVFFDQLDLLKQLGVAPQPG